MSNLIACQPGWVAVFRQVDGDGYTTEPIACWLLLGTQHQPEIRPVCALGGDICDATLAVNYLGALGPGGDPKKLIEAHRTSTAHRPTAA